MLREYKRCRSASVTISTPARPCGEFKRCAAAISRLSSLLHRTPDARYKAPSPRPRCCALRQPPRLPFPITLLRPCRPIPIRPRARTPVSSIRSPVPVRILANIHERHDPASAQEAPRFPLKRPCYGFHDISVGGRERAWRGYGGSCRHMGWTGRRSGGAGRGLG